MPVRPGRGPPPCNGGCIAGVGGASAAAVAVAVAGLAAETGGGPCCCWSPTLAWYMGMRPLSGTGTPWAGAAGATRGVSAECLGAGGKPGPEARSAAAAPWNPAGVRHRSRVRRLLCATTSARRFRMLFTRQHQHGLRKARYKTSSAMCIRAPRTMLQVGCLNQQRQEDVDRSRGRRRSPTGSDCNGFSDGSAVDGGVAAAAPPPVPPPCMGEQGGAPSAPYPPSKGGICEHGCRVGTRLLPTACCSLSSPRCATLCQALQHQAGGSGGRLRDALPGALAAAVHRCHRAPWAQLPHQRQVPARRGTPVRLHNKGCGTCRPADGLASSPAVLRSSLTHFRKLLSPKHRYFDRQQPQAAQERTTGTCKEKNCMGGKAAG